MKIKINIVLMLFVLLSLTLQAQTRSRLSKVGFVDSSVIYNSILEDDNLLEIIKVKFQRDQENFKALIDDIKIANNEISDLKKEINSSTNSSQLQAQLKVKEEEIDKLQEQYKRLSILTSRKNQSVNVEVQRHIAAAIIIITRREGYTAILERNDFILYVDKDFDITNQILAFVRESIKKLEN